MNSDSLKFNTLTLAIWAALNYGIPTGYED